uniref:Uncharacterized protein n=1 Tax=Chromera velia CCMP2878 TaxID=1169474 RepID=A0A0G4I7R6_9ALVE|eukprot:Cvel_1942.t1-p1 / transcript=Cvel_1942.t1 / gene=Cvel_1942 / organism=Chromera_velia_CCMP2878 / gene_product=hypothetical protein / transcript_product=hypothetical protein / location=Cvel_scaffold73:66196-75879(+) / protein_length=709 / sequence_SO=supercontig / SO=protein_coding / is_pseudo=false
MNVEQASSNDEAKQRFCYCIRRPSSLRREMWIVSGGFLVETLCAFGTVRMLLPAFLTVTSSLAVHRKSRKAASAAFLVASVRLFLFFLLGSNGEERDPIRWADRIRSRLDPVRDFLDPFKPVLTGFNIVLTVLPRCFPVGPNWLRAAEFVFCLILPALFFGVVLGLFQFYACVVLEDAARAPEKLNTMRRRKSGDGLNRMIAGQSGHYSTEHPYHHHHEATVRSPERRPGAFRSAPHGMGAQTPHTPTPPPSAPRYPSEDGPSPFPVSPEPQMRMPQSAHPFTPASGGATGSRKSPGTERLQRDLRVTEALRERECQNMTSDVLNFGLGLQNSLDPSKDRGVYMKLKSDGDKLLYHLDSAGFPRDLGPPSEEETANFMMRRRGLVTDLVRALDDLDCRFEGAMSNQTAQQVALQENLIASRAFLSSAGRLLAVVECARGGGPVLIAEVLREEKGNRELFTWLKRRLGDLQTRLDSLPAQDSWPDSLRERKRRTARDLSALLDSRLLGFVGAAIGSAEGEGEGGNSVGGPSADWRSRLPEMPPAAAAPVREGRGSAGGGSSSSSSSSIGHENSEGVGGGLGDSAGKWFAKVEAAARSAVDALWTLDESRERRGGGKNGNGNGGRGRGREKEGQMPGGGGSPTSLVQERWGELHEHVVRGEEEEAVELVRSLCRLSRGLRTMRRELQLWTEGVEMLRSPERQNFLDWLQKG